MKYLTPLLLGLLACAPLTEVTDCFPQECGRLATVVNLQGLDGCGLALELPDGKRLLPERRTYVRPPSPSEDPLYYFELKAGEQVQLAYRPAATASTCMAGELVFITCIKSLIQPSSHE
jgi:hypothetical protein